MKPPSVWWMTDETRVADPMPVLVRLPRGAAVILRHYQAPDRPALAGRMAQHCRALGLSLLVAGDWRLAAAVRAQGLHLPDFAARRGPAPGARLWSKRRLLSVAAHDARGLAHARALNADAALLSPVFATASHGGAKILGITRASLLARAVKLPVLALGGVRIRQAGALKRRGFSGVAGIGFALKD